MILKEKLEIRGEPFPKPLPLPPKDLISLLRNHGHEFYFEDGILRLRDEYDPKRLDNVKSVLVANNLESKVDVWRTVWPIYDAIDYATADFLILLFPEISISGIDFAVKCESCGRRRVLVVPETRVQRVKCDSPIVTVNGQFTIVRKDVAALIKKQLIGTSLPPFDEEKRYSYLNSKGLLRRLIINESQVIGLNGTCPLCKSPVFEMFFGPLRYARSEFAGGDVIQCDFYCCNVYSQKAYLLLKDLEKRVAIHGIVFLEGT